jgi:hypothetical protein
MRCSKNTPKESNPSHRGGHRRASAESAWTNEAEDKRFSFPHSALSSLSPLFQVSYIHMRQGCSAFLMLFPTRRFSERSHFTVTPS